MTFDKSSDVKIGENVTVKNDRCFLNAVGRKTIRAARAERSRFGYEAQIYTVVRAVAEDMFDLVRLVTQRQCDVRDARLSQDLDLVEEECPIAERDHGLGRINGQRPQTSAFAAR